MWNASRFCVSSLRRGHANLLCIVPILVYVFRYGIHNFVLLWHYLYPVRNDRPSLGVDFAYFCLILINVLRFSSNGQLVSEPTNKVPCINIPILLKLQHLIGKWLACNPRGDFQKDANSDICRFNLHSKSRHVPSSKPKYSINCDKLRVRVVHGDK